MNKTVKNSAIYLSGTIIMGVLGFVNTVLLTRILSQQTYAMYGLLTTFINSLVTFISFGYDTSYMRFYYNNGLKQSKFLFECLKTPFLIFVVSSIILIFPQSGIIKYVFGERFPIYVTFILIGLIFCSFLHKFTRVTVRMEECAFNFVISSAISKTGFIFIVLTVFLLYKKCSFYLVMLSFLISSLLSVLINLLVFKKAFSKNISSDNTVTQKDLFSYGFPYMINNFLLLLIPTVEKLIIRDLAGWEILSIFTASSIFQTVVLLVVQTIDNVWNPIVYKHCDNTETFRPILHKFGLAGTLITSVGLSFCVLLRRWLVLLLDEKYHSIYIIVPAVFLGAMFNITAMIYGVGINIKKKTIHYVISPILQLVLSLGMAYLLIPRYGLIGVGLSTLISITVSRFYRVIVGLKLYNTKENEFKSLFLNGVCILLSVLSMFFISVYSDILICLILLLMTVFVTFKDIIPLYKSILSLIKK